MRMIGNDGNDGVGLLRVFSVKKRLVVWVEPHPMAARLPSPWDPLLVSPWEGEGDGSRERGHVVVFWGCCGDGVGSGGCLN